MRPVRGAGCTGHARGVLTGSATRPGTGIQPGVARWRSGRAVGPGSIATLGTALYDDVSAPGPAPRLYQQSFVLSIIYRSKLKSLRAVWARRLWYTSAPRNRPGYSPMSAPQPTRSATETRPAVRVLEVGEAADGQRLDNFLHARLKGAPKSLVYRIIRSGEVRVNGKRAKAESRLAAGDAVRVPPLRLADSDPSPLPSSELANRLKDAVLYRDTYLMVLNKPAGLAVHAGTGMRLGLVEALRAMFPEYPGLELVHRLDKGTSGCVLLALDGRARRALSDAFRSREVEKCYELIVAGR